MKCVLIPSFSELIFTEIIFTEHIFTEIVKAK